METIRNYLETMFSNLPNTPEVIRAKNELWQMMEDKYTELKSDGKTENEAVGTVISEFGNLDELSEDLGIRQFVHFKTAEPGKRTVTKEDGRRYLKENTSHAFMIALGVFLCIISPLGAILFDKTSLSDLGGALFLFLCVAAAVSLFIISGIMHQRWEYLKKEPCTMDFATTAFIKDEKERNRLSYSLFLTIGIALCILSVVPSIIITKLNMKIAWMHKYDMGAVLLFLFVAVGVFMIVMASIVNGGYNTLLKINSPDTVGGNFVPSQQSKVVYSNQTVKAIMSVYWSTVTCIYLIISFLTFEWGITWIIWPIAAVIEALIKNIWKKQEV